MTPSHAFPRRWRILSTLCGVLVALALAEGILRVTGTGWLAARVAPDDARFIEDSPGTDNWPVVREDGEPIALVPGSTLEVRHPAYRFVFHTDQWGGRVTGAAQASPPEVVFLGDSQTFGIGVGDTDTFTALLAARLNRRIANLGMPGSSLPHEIAQLSFRHETVGRPPVYVIWFFAGNDLSDPIFESAGPDPMSRRRDTSGFLAGLDARLTPVVGNLDIVRITRGALLTWMNEQPFRVTDQFLFLTSPDRSELRALAEAMLDRELTDLTGLADRLHVRIVFAMIPDMMQVYPAALARRAAHYRLTAPVDVDYPNRVLGQALARRHIAFVDPTDCMRRMGEGLYYPESHLTVAGHAALADCTAETLRGAIGPR